MVCAEGAATHVNSTDVLVPAVAFPLLQTEQFSREYVFWRDAPLCFKLRFYMWKELGLGLPQRLGLQLGPR